jgi:hypothetical protein
MPLSQWLQEWHGDIREGFEQCVRTAGRIELRCPPPKLGPGAGFWQQLREVCIMMMMQSLLATWRLLIQACMFVMTRADLILGRFNAISTLEIPSQS